ncbi:MAG: Rrf2 family transcriptional regulator [Gammaproteobacteria bacterium]|nr:Rrf2 family transcriptional regulator [Gammaproteobacteria bacterium]
MKISSKGRYAVAAMMDLALHENKGPLTISDISEKQNISLSYLEQIFADLRKGNLVRGTRGPGGGYRLARDAAEISIAQIIDVLDEKRPRLDIEDERYQPYQLWAHLSRRMHEFLHHISLQECIDDVVMVEQLMLSKEHTEAA